MPCHSRRYRNPNRAELSSLKHGKDDIKEAGVNTECGVSIKSFNDVVAGDLIETFEQVEVAKTL